MVVEGSGVYCKLYVRKPRIHTRQPPYIPVLLTPTPFPLAVISSSITCYKFVACCGGMGTGLVRGGGSYVIRTKIETE
jgi:hypothetical protein